MGKVLRRSYFIALCLVSLCTVAAEHYDTPTVSACGTDPSIEGDDFAGVVTIGSGVVTSCTITFAKAYAVAPSCVITSDAVIVIRVGAISTTTVTLNSGVSIATNIIHYQCHGL
jgi:hypothetical protein